MDPTAPGSPTIRCAPCFKRTTIRVLLSRSVPTHQKNAAEDLFLSILFDSRGNLIEFDTTEDINEATHVIVVANSDGLCPLTLNYIKGVVHGKWVVSSSWLQECVKLKRIPNEQAYEVEGDQTYGRTLAPYLSRRSRILGDPLLFENLVMFVGGATSLLPNDEISAILVELGATLAPSLNPSPDLFQLKPSRVLHLLDCHDDDCSATGVITVQWVVECIAFFQLLPHDNL